MARSKSFHWRFYKKIDKGVIHSIDFKNMEYTPMHKKRYPSIRIAKESTELEVRLKSLVLCDDACAEFLWNSISAKLCCMLLHLLEK